MVKKTLILIITYNINNASLLDATIKSLIETKRFDVQLFWFSTDVMALTLILLWIFIFSLFSCFVLFLLLSFYYFQIIIIIFVSRYINIYMSKCQYIQKKFENMSEKLLSVCHLNWKILESSALYNVITTFARLAC